MSSKSRITWILSLPVLVAGALVLRPVPIVPESECEVAVGRVASIGEGGTLDVVFALENESRRFYINRGLERGLDMTTLRRELVGEVVTLKYPRYWTPLDPSGATRHVSVLIHGERVLFDETPQ